MARASDGERLIYTLPKPALDGSCQITLTPLELIDRLVRFIPAPRRHLHRYHGAFAPHCALRARVVTRAGQAIAPPVAAPDDLAKVIHHQLGQSPHASYAPAPVPAVPAQASSWARLIARIYEVDPLRCRHCGGAMQLIVFIVELDAIVTVAPTVTFGPVVAIAPGLGQIKAVAKLCPCRIPVQAGKWGVRGGPVDPARLLFAVLSC